MGATVFYADPAAEIASLANTFLVGGVPTDPSTVVCTITDPQGNAVTHTYLAASPADITRDSPGVYELDVPTTLAGVWLYAWAGTGAATDVQEGTWTALTIDNSLYCTPEELKSRLQIGDSADDFEVILAVQAACRNIDEITGRYFWQGPATRTYVPESIYQQTTDDLVSVTSLMVDRDGDGVYEETWTQGTDYQLTVAPGRYNTAAKGETWPFTGFNILGPKFIPVVWPWSHLDRIQVTGVFGWPAVPLAVKQAALVSAADLFRLKDAPFGVAGFGEFGAVKITANPRVMGLLKRYINGQRVGV